MLFFNSAIGCLLFVPEKYLIARVLHEIIAIQIDF
jgi:hypothetical protein